MRKQHFAKPYSAKQHDTGSGWWMHTSWRSCTLKFAVWSSTYHTSHFAGRQFRRLSMSLPAFPTTSTYNTMRALKKRQDAFLGNPMHEASEQTARGSIKKQVWGGMFPRTAQNMKWNSGQRWRAMLTAIGDTRALLLLNAQWRLCCIKIRELQNIFLIKFT